MVVITMDGPVASKLAYLQLMPETVKSVKLNWEAFNSELELTRLDEYMGRIL